MTDRIPGPTHEAVLALLLLDPAPMTDHVALTVWVPFLTGTTKSKLFADRVLKIRSKLQSGLGPTHTPVVAPVGMLQVKPVPRLAQSASDEQTVEVGAAAQAVSCEKS